MQNKVSSSARPRENLLSFERKKIFFSRGRALPLPSCYARFYTVQDSSKTGQYKMQTADCKLQTGYKMQTRYEMQI